MKWKKFQYLLNKRHIVLLGESNTRYYFNCAMIKSVICTRHRRPKRETLQNNATNHSLVFTSFQRTWDGHRGNLSSVPCGFEKFIHFIAPQYHFSLSSQRRAKRRIFLFIFYTPMSSRIGLSSENSPPPRNNQRKIQFQQFSKQVRVRGVFSTP